MAERFASMNPEDFGEGGAFLDDVDVTIADAIFAMTDYEGKVPNEVPVAILTFDIDGEESTQFYSVGDRKNYGPSADGKNLVLLGSAERLNKTSKWGMLLKSMVDNGFPPDGLGDIKSIVGTTGHVVRSAVDFGNLPGKAADAKQQTVVLFDRIDKTPSENKSAKGTKGKGKTTAKAAPDAPVDEDLQDEAAGIMLEILANCDGSVKTNQVIVKAAKLQSLKDASDRKAVTALLTSEEFVTGGDRPWSVADGTISAG